MKMHNILLFLVLVARNDTPSAQTKIPKHKVQGVPQFCVELRTFKLKSTFIMVFKQKLYSLKVLNMIRARNKSVL